MNGHRLLVNVRGDDGGPIGNARVTLRDPQGGNGVELRTKSDGTVVFMSTWDNVNAKENFQLNVIPADGRPAIEQVVPAKIDRWEVKVDGYKGTLPKNLDLVLLIDTTGSMGDELAYLKSEIKSIAQAVQTKFPEINQRFALVLYRDQGDEYVTRKFDFTGSLDEFRERLSAQASAGGGDYPEAMHRGVDDLIQLQWRTEDTARIVFLIGDAPPHPQFVDQTMAAVDRLRKNNVVIYPVAASGADPATEFIMRSMALLTGGHYLFLTDDSGVGAAHAEPHFPFYHVQRLEQLMIRMIASELAGRRLEPERDQIVRTVGKPVNFAKQ
jgi:hypothetical protein